MLKNYFKTMVRNLRKNKTFSFLNIFGLAIGITYGGGFYRYPFHGSFLTRVQPAHAQTSFIKYYQPFPPPFFADHRNGLRTYSRELSIAVFVGLQSALFNLPVAIRTVYFPT
jgi:hypothetical protein